MNVFIGIFSIVIGFSFMGGSSFTISKTQAISGNGFYPLYPVGIFLILVGILLSFWDLTKMLQNKFNEYDYDNLRKKFFKVVLINCISIFFFFGTVIKKYNEVYSFFRKKGFEEILLHYKVPIILNNPFLWTSIVSLWILVVITFELKRTMY